MVQIYFDLIRNPEMSNQHARKVRQLVGCTSKLSAAVRSRKRKPFHAPAEPCSQLNPCIWQVPIDSDLIKNLGKSNWNVIEVQHLL